MPSPPLTQPGRRIVVVGTSGSGKTTMAQALAARRNLPHTEIDSLNWGPDWTQRPVDDVRARLGDAIAAPAWVVDGNYSRVRDLLWPRADTIVWLNYGLPTILWRLLRRTLRRTLGREILWSGNRERLYTHLFTRDSLFLWVLQTYRRRRREYPALLARPEHAHLTVIELRTPRQAQRWLDHVNPG